MFGWFKRKPDLGLTGQDRAQAVARKWVAAREQATYAENELADAIQRGEMTFERLQRRHRALAHLSGCEAVLSAAYLEWVNDIHRF